MSNIDKQALREAAEKADSIGWDGIEYELDVGPRATEFISRCSPAAVTALLDELEAKDKLIAELSHHLQSAHEFIEHTEAFGHEASNGILCCGDAQWNIDASKSALAAAGKGEAS